MSKPNKTVQRSAIQKLGQQIEEQRRAQSYEASEAGKTRDPKGKYLRRARARLLARRNHHAANPRSTAGHEHKAPGSMKK